MNEDRRIVATPYYCPDCHSFLGWATPEGGLLAGGIVVERGGFYCIACGRMRGWRKSTRLGELLAKVALRVRY